MKNKDLIPFRETAAVALGEGVVSAIVIGVFALIGKYDYTVLLGALLGSLVIILNFLFLSLATNRAIDKIMVLRGSGEMDDEEAAKFAQENAMKLQNTVKLSYIIRTLSMLAAFIVALITKQFNVIATVIPLFMLRPIIYVMEIFRKKSSAEPASAPVEDVSYREIPADEAEDKSGSEQAEEDAPAGDAE